jgi:2-polyprenyl-3-methyl-5-hydroxy-6-metoxy-1,4-benzoquinol methylase
VTTVAASLFPARQGSRLDYAGLKRRIAPGLRFNQDLYEEALLPHVQPDTVWLDAGCGWHVLPPWRHAAERSLVERARLVVGSDVDLESVRKHRSIRRVHVAELTRLPLRSESFDVITCNMVVEHLDVPVAVFAELARVLAPGGRLIIHTPNAGSYYVLASRLCPPWLKSRLVSTLDGRPLADIFPTRYRANTPARLRAMLSGVGLREESIRLLASEAVLRAVPLLLALELLYIRLTLLSPLRLLRASLLATFVKPERPSAMPGHP